jgi:pilus assembly protein Flp/PilA
MTSDFEKLSSAIHRLSSRFADDESGATVIEYAVLAGFISMAILTGLSFLGSSLSAHFQAAADGLAG